MAPTMLLPPLLLLLTGPEAQAVDVLAPDFSARAVSDLPIAASISAETLRALRNRGLDVADMEILHARTGGMANDCAEHLACPGDLWGPFSEARLAVVGQAGASVAGTTVSVRFYAFNQAMPVEEITLDVAPGAETGFAQRVAERAQVLLERMPDRVAGPVAPPPAPSPAPVPAPAPAPAREEVSDTPMFLPPWDRRRFEESGLSESEFRDQARLRTGKTALEVFGGAAFGDLDRRYDVRLAVEGGQTADTYQYTTFINGRAPDLGFAVGHAPFAWLEATISLGLQISQQAQQVGVTTLSGSGETTQTAEFTSGKAALGVFTPGVRVLPLTVGAIKVYGLLALPFRFAPPVPESTALGQTFPSAPGTLSLGLSLGGGIALDTANGVFGYVEVPWTLELSPVSRSAGGEGFPTLPTETTGVGQLIVFRLGVGKRF